MIFMVNVDNVFEYVIIARIGIAESGSDFVNMALKMFFCFVLFSVMIKRKIANFGVKQQ